jgi:predicted 3-demethylubiquinone-9 3-methyltransferase (glyoxalase superfamily)
MIHKGFWMANKVTPFLMFDGFAEEAMRFYIALFTGSGIIRLERYGSGEPSAEGSVKRDDFTVSALMLL